MQHRRLVPLFVAAVLAVVTVPFFSIVAFAAPQYKVLHAFGKGKDGGGLWTSVSLDKKGGVVFEITP